MRLFILGFLLGVTVLQVNEKRKFGTNNYGDVWVVATYTAPGSDKPLVAKTYFIVTVPAYMRWDQPEVAQ